MKLVVGLGNPGGQYAKTYHNIGYITIDRLVKSLGGEFNKTKCKSEICKIGDVVFAKPITFMNLSGDAVAELKKYFRIPLENILIIYDDIDLNKGCFRYRENGSAGTHNGMRDIVKKVGETKRIRIGIGKPEKMDLADYVLSNIDMMSREQIDEAISLAIEKIKEFIFDSNEEI